MHANALTLLRLAGRCGGTLDLVANIFSDLIETAALEVQDAGAVSTALARYRKGSVDLHDCLIVSLAEQRKARVVTFDAKEVRRLGMELLR